VADSLPLLANVVFLEWTFVNREPVSLDSAFITLWTDIDFGSASGNVPAIDTSRQLVYCWQRGNYFGDFPMAVGFLTLRGPVQRSPGDSAFFRGRWKPGFKNLPMSSFWGIMDDSFPDTSRWGPAYSLGTMWNIARGLDKVGRPIVNPVTGSVTTFPYSGDPVTQTGWVHNGSTSGGAGFNAFFGPLTMAPNDTQWILVALVPARGQNQLDAIQVLRQYSDELRAMPYDSLLNATFTHTPWRDPVPEVSKLFQNYPNPFNAGTSIGYQITSPGLVTLKVFDVLGREVAVMVNEMKVPGVYSVRFSAAGGSGYRLSSGVYFYCLQAGDFVQTRKLMLIK
jgi:hypothetical protein